MILDNPEDKFSHEARRLLAWIAQRQGELELTDSLLQLAARAGVLHVLASDNDFRKNLGSYSAEYMATAALGALKLENLREISCSMDRHGLEIMPIKGMAYALMFGSGGPTRPMADVDFLVRERDFSNAVEVMKDLGYEERYFSRASRSTNHNELAFVRNGQLVEIHRAFVVRGRISVDYESLFARSKPMESEGIKCRIMSPEDSFLYHCFHMGLHEFAVGGLRTVVELLDLLEKYPPDMELATRRAKVWGTCRITWCAMRIARTCMPGKIDPAWVESFAPGVLVRSLLQHLVVTPSLELMFSPGKLPRPVQLMRKALLLDRSYLAPGYLVRYLINA